MKTGVKSIRWQILIAMIAVAFSSIPATATCIDSISKKKSNVSFITINGRVYEVSDGANIRIDGDKVSIRTDAGEMVIVNNDGYSYDLKDQQKIMEEASREAQKAREQAIREAQKAREKAITEAQKALSLKPI